MDPTAIPLPASRRNSTLPTADAQAIQQDIVLDSASIDSFATLAQLAHSIALPETAHSSPEVTLVKQLGLAEPAKEEEKEDAEQVKSPGVLDGYPAVFEQVVAVAVDAADQERVRDDVVDELTVAHVQEKLMEVVRRGSVEPPIVPNFDRAEQQAVTAEEELISAVAAESPEREVVLVQVEAVVVVPDAADIALTPVATTDPESVVKTAEDDALMAADRSFVDEIVDGIGSHPATQDRQDSAHLSLPAVAAHELIPDQPSAAITESATAAKSAAATMDQLADSVDTLSLTTPSDSDAAVAMDRPSTPPAPAEVPIVTALESDAESLIPASDSDRDQATASAALTTDDELDTTTNRSQYTYSTAAETETEGETTDAELDSLRRASIQSEISSTSLNDSEADESDIARAQSPTPSSTSTTKRLSTVSNTSTASRASAASSSSSSAGKKPATATHSLKTPVKKPAAVSTPAAQFKVPTKPASRTAAAAKTGVNKLAASSSSSSGVFKAPTVPVSRSVPPKTPTSKAVSSSLTRGTAASDARTKKPATPAANTAHLGPATPHPSTITDTTKINQLRGISNASPSKQPSSASSLNARLKSAGTAAAAKALTSGTRGASAAGSSSSSAAGPSSTAAKTPTRSMTRPVSGAAYSTTANKPAASTTASTTIRATKSSVPTTPSSSRPRTLSTLTSAAAADVAKLHAEIAELKAMVVALATRVNVLESASAGSSGKQAEVVAEQVEGQDEVAAVSV